MTTDERLDLMLRHQQTLERKLDEALAETRHLRKLVENITGMSSTAINASQQLVRCPLAERRL